MRTDFYYHLEDGIKHVSEMTREDLLRVIDDLRASQEFWKAEAHQNLRRWAAIPAGKRSLLAKFFS